MNIVVDLSWTSVMSSMMLFNAVWKMSNTRPIDRAPQLWCANLWVLPANQLTVIQIATLRMANSLDVEIISSDESSMKRFYWRMWLFPQIRSWSSKNSIFGIQFLNIAMEPIQIKSCLLPDARYTCIRYSLGYFLIIHVRKLSPCPFGKFAARLNSLW